jgi:hypothetical protein
MKCDDMGGRLTDRAEMHFDEAVLSPPMLRAFLQAMPKGAELHYHLTGGALRREPDTAGCQ